MFVMAVLYRFGFFFSVHSLPFYLDCMQPNNALQRIFQYQWHNKHTSKLICILPLNRNHFHHGSNQRIFRSPSDESARRMPTKYHGKWQNRSVWRCREWVHTIFVGSSLEMISYKFLLEQPLNSRRLTGITFDVMALFAVCYLTSTWNEQQRHKCLKPYGVRVVYKV